MRRAGVLRVAVAVLLLQGLGLLGAAVFLLVRSGGDDTRSLGGALVGALVALLGAVAFAGLGLALRPPPRRSAVTPALLLEALCLPVAYGLFQGGQPAYGVPVLALAVTGLVCVVLGAGVTPRP